MPYALLQLSLEQTISRQELEDASIVAPSVARADCALLQRELLGIVVANLEHEEALALQDALRQRNFPTEVIDQSILPVLPTPQMGHALRLTEVGIVLIDLYDREHVYPREQFVFAAAGHLLHLKNRPYRNMEWVITPGPRGSVNRRVEMVTEHRLEDVPEFRLEFFFDAEVPRLQWLLTSDSVLNVNGDKLRLRNLDQIHTFLQTLANLLPSDRVNLGIKKTNAGENFIYPSVRAFEEEIVWTFYQMTRGPN
jgi:hypothetical protein